MDSGQNKFFLNELRSHSSKDQNKIKEDTYTNHKLKIKVL